MASNPGILTDWPWKPLGSFKYLILSPWVIHYTYSFLVKGDNDLSSFLIFPFLLWRMLHNQLWISLSRYWTTKGKNRILDKGIEFDQLDREKNWDDQILLNGILFYIVTTVEPRATHLPVWRTDGLIITIILHTGPVEFLYYWFHRLLHHHYLYSRYHSHHHSSIVTEPISSVIHPFAEHIVYFMLFTIPLLTVVLTGTASIGSYSAYVTYLDFMNNMGHCNFELFPKWLLAIFPPVKYIIYTPSFHSLHHTQFRTNYSLFMPIYDYIYGTMDKACDSQYENSVKRQDDMPEVVHLTHLTTPHSIYHLRFAFPHLASTPQSSKCYLWFLWPLTLWTLILTWVYGSTSFVVQRHRFHKLKLQTWVIPKYSIQYCMQYRKESINNMIGQAILEAEQKGVKVLSLGLLNQAEELNNHGELHVLRNPKLKVKVVDGSSLAVAIVLNSIPEGTTQILLRGSLNKLACAVAFSLCQRGIQVTTPVKEDYEKIKASLGSDFCNNLHFTSSYCLKTWIVNDGLSEEEQRKAKEGTLFIPLSQFPPKRYRKDCFYYSTPAMVAPASLENVDSCENWLPRRVMSASRVAGIVHALEGWNVDECGSNVFNVDQVWKATLKHGFKPVIMPTMSTSLFQF